MPISGANELLLRHLIKHNDRKFSIRPELFSSSIGRALKSCENLPLASFTKIDIRDFSKLENAKDLSSDQKYLWYICQAVCSGKSSFDQSKSNPGYMSLSRWLITTANPIR